MKWNRSLKLGSAIFLGSIVLHFQKGIDFKIQDFFHLGDRWLVSSTETDLHRFMYEWAKFFPWVVAVPSLFLFIFKWIREKKLNVALGCALLYIAIVPLLTNSMKAVSAQPCPNEFLSLGGTLPDSLFFHRGARCFPGAHSSAGFALAGLCFLVGDAGKRRILLWITFMWGFAIGLYQMARGMHFLSDTTAALGIAGVVFGWIESRLHPKI